MCAKAKSECVLRSACVLRSESVLRSACVIRIACVCAWNGCVAYLSVGKWIVCLSLQFETQFPDCFSSPSPDLHQIKIPPPSPPPQPEGEGGDQKGRKTRIDPLIFYFSRAWLVHCKVGYPSSFSDFGLKGKLLNILALCLFKGKVAQYFSSMLVSSVEYFWSSQPQVK